MCGVSEMWLVCTICLYLFALCTLLLYTEDFPLGSVRVIDEDVNWPFKSETMTSGTIAAKRYASGPGLSRWPCLQTVSIIEGTATRKMPSPGRRGCWTEWCQVILFGASVLVILAERTASKWYEAAELNPPVPAHVKMNNTTHTHLRHFYLCDLLVHSNEYNLLGINCLYLLAFIYCNLCKNEKIICRMYNAYTCIYIECV